MSNSPTILDHRGEPLRRHWLTREVAAPQPHGLRQNWHASSADDLTPEQLAHILRLAKLGHGNAYLTLAEEMEERDMHYASVLGTRKLAVSGLDVRVDALSDDPRDVEIADAVRELVAGAAFEAMRFDLADALGRGYAVSEIMWDRSGKSWTPAQFEPRDQRFFQFDRLTGRTLRLRDEADPQEGLTLPAYKFIVHQPRLRAGLPLRGGLAFLCAPGYMCKAWAWKDWMAFADIYGIPLRVGRHGVNAKPKDVETLIAAVANLASDGAAVLPESTRIEIEEAANTAGAGQFFEGLANWWDRQISKAVLGQTMTADDGASLSQAKVHNEVRLDLLTADARAEQLTLNRDLVKPFVDLNFGPGRYPKLVVVVPEPEDTRLLIDALEKLVPMGLKVEQSVIRDKLGLPDPDEGANVELLHAPVAAPSFAPAGAPTPKPAQAENRETDASAHSLAGELADTMAQQAQPAWDAILDRIQQLVDDAPDLPTLRERLAEAYTDLPVKDLGEVLQMGFVVAELAGRHDLQQESGDA